MWANVAKVLGMYLIKKYLPELAFDLVLAGAEKIASKTSTQVDDEWVDKVKHDKEEILKEIRKMV